MLKLLIIPLLSFFDRLGGGGFGWLGAKGYLAQGHLLTRRYGIPLIVFLLHPTFSQGVLCVAMGAMFAFNNKAIEERNWEEIFLQGFGLAAVIWPLAGIYSLLIPAWWMLGVYLSNVGINTWKLGWHYVELIRGLLIGTALALGGGHV